MKVYTCFPGGKAKALTMSYDDGKLQDKRLIGIFNKYGIKATFNLNYGQVGERPRMTFEEMEGLYDGHEIATHTMTHPTIERCPLVEVAEELLEDRKGLEKWTGRIIRGHAYMSASQFWQSRCSNDARSRYPLCMSRRAAVRLRPAAAENPPRP